MASAGEGFLMGDWAELPSDLLTLIVKQIDLYEDFVGFGGACRSWRSVAVKENFNHSPQIPWLMLLGAEEKGGGGNNLSGFVSLTKGGMIQRAELPRARTWTSCFSSMGWLITTNAADDMELLHPLTRVCIPLPHPKTLKYYSSRTCNMLLKRAVLSASPSVTEDYVLMVKFRSCYVVFWKPGNSIWTVIEQYHPYWIRDVVYYKDQFYAISYEGNLLLCNMNSCTSQIVGQIDERIVGKNQVYLVECGGELLLVSGSTLIHHYTDGYKTYDISFEVFKFDSTDFNKLHPVYDFGGSSIFVGYCTSASAITASVAGTKSNCIYFSEEGYLNRYTTLNRSEYKGTGMYNWEDQSEERVISKRVFPNEKQQPIWVSPSF